MKKNWQNARLLVACLLIPLIIGFLGSLLTTPSIDSWYALLNKPSFNPPNAIFGPVWTGLFILMGLALFLVLKSSRRSTRAALISFFVQLFLNIGWSALFFYWHSPFLAFLEIIILWLAIAVNIFFFSRSSKIAAWLLVPYLAWVSFAAFLNYTIWRLN